MPRTLCPEMDQWLAERELKRGEEEEAVRDAFRNTPIKVPKSPTSPQWTWTVDLTEAEWRFLFSRFQGVGTPIYSFARRLQTSAGDVMKMSGEQRHWVLALAWKYRRKVIHSGTAAKMDCKSFVLAIKRLAPIAK